MRGTASKELLQGDESKEIKALFGHGATDFEGLVQ